MRRMAAAAIVAFGLSGLLISVVDSSAQPLPNGLQPTVDWAQFPIIAMLLIVIGILLWRFERHLERKDAMFVQALSDHDGKTGASMEKLTGAMRELTVHLNERDRQIFKWIATGSAMSAVLAHAVLRGEGSLTAEDVRTIVNEHFKVSGGA